MRSSHKLLIGLFGLFVYLTPMLASGQPPGPAAQLAAVGWEEIGPQVYQRTTEDGFVETFGWGAEAIARELDYVRQSIGELEAARRDLEAPSAELLQALSYHVGLARELEADLAEAEASGPVPGLQAVTAALGCTLVITRDAYAYPTSTGPAASAFAAFSDSCPTVGQVNAAAHADGYENGALRSADENDPASGRRDGMGSASASASASVVASENCHSHAVARVWIVDSNGVKVLFLNSASNTQCRTVVDPCVQHPKLCFP